MAAKIIAVVNQKGGSGKTTVAMHLGACLGLRNYKVQIVDGDEQNSAVEWASLAPEGQPFPTKVCSLAKAGRKIHQEIKKIFDENDFIIVDCPPAADSPVAQSALLISDIALVPFIPDGLNLMAATRIRDTIDDAMILNPELKAFLVLNRVEQKTKITKSVIDLLPDFNMDICKVQLHKRTHYAEAVLLGGSVHIFRNKAKDAIEEIEAFTEEVLSFLKVVKEAKKPVDTVEVEI